MCGITGIIDHSNGEELYPYLKKMTDGIRHRGPDDEGYFVDEKERVALGHRRLSIIDLSGGKQPLTNETDDLVLVFNGEIYNYMELREELIKKGHRFKTETDSEVIIHLYEEEKEDCLKFLNGMFAFAIWDKKNKTLFLSRDRLGQKPLFYGFRNGLFLFASELSALNAHPRLDKEISYSSIYQYLILGYITAPETVYEKVYKLEPGSFLIFKDGNFKTAPYWDLSYEDNGLSLSETQEELERLFKDSVRKRMISHVPLGVFLSGGVDSSLVALQMAELSPRPVKTFSIGFDHQDYNELGYAREVADYIKSEHHELVVTPKASEILPELVRHYGEPYSDSSAIPTYYVSKMTREKVTVALNGDGGDESFVGYDRYKAVGLSEKMAFLPAALSKAFAAVLPDSTNFKNPVRRLKRFLKVSSYPLDERYLRWISNINKVELRKLLTGKMNIDDDRFFASFFSGKSPRCPIEKALYCDIKRYLPFDLLVKVDIATMIHSLEGRSPFLDHRLVEFAASIPLKYKFKDYNQKHLLKSLILKKMPRYNVVRKKYGFGVPLGDWLRNDLKELTNSTLLSTRFKNRGLFNYHEVEKRIMAHQKDRKDYTYFIYSLLFLELWFNEFIDG